MPDETIMRGTDRVLKISKLDPKANVTSSTGMVDNRLFSGENKLHAVMDDQTCLWYMKYDSGIVPEELKQRFTTYNKLLQFATEYFAKRNIKIEE